MSRLVLLLPALLGLLASARSASADEASANPSLEKEVESYLAETAPQTSDNTFKAFWKNGLQFETADKSFTTHVGGRVLFDMAYFGSEDYGGANQQDSWYFRDVYLTVEGTVFTNGIFKAEVDFATGTSVLRECFLGLRNCGPAGTLRAGQFKMPFTLGDMTNTLFVTFMERAACVAAFAPAYQDGVSVANTFLEKRLFAAVGCYKVSTSAGNGTATDNGGYGIVARFAYAFLEDKEQNRILQLGFDVLFASTPAGTKQYRARPDIFTGARFVDTGAVAAADETIFDFEVLFTWKKMHVQGEFIWAELNGNGGPEPSFSGFYVEAAYWIKGGRPNYNKERHTLDRPAIDGNFHAGGGGLGGWQLALRFDNLDLTDSGVAGGSQDAITLGIHWWWNPTMVLKFNVVWASIDDGGPFGPGDITVFGTRVQVDF